MLQVAEPKRKKGQTDVLQLACEPMERIRMAFIGLGKRGNEAFNHYLYIDQVDIIALCDVNLERIASMQEKLKAHNRPAALEYSEDDDWKKICERTDIDLLYICTHWHLHTPIAAYAMKRGKHVAVEVPAALTIEECWHLVDTAEITRRHCFMLENCCYDYFEMAVLNMAQQGLLGDIIHCEGAYIHDLRFLDFDHKPDYLKFWMRNGNPYPTHGLGPLCQLLNIHRGDKLEMLVSMSSNLFDHPRVEGTMVEKQFTMGNINSTIFRTRKGKTILLQHDVTSPRPRSRNYLVSGTKGFAQKRSVAEIFLESEPNGCLNKEELNALLKKYESPFYKEVGELAQKVGAHGGMDFIMDYRLIYCLRKGLPLDQDVYDAAEWSCVSHLSEQSVLGGSIPVKIPDFTRGSWDKLKGLQFAL